MKKELKDYINFYLPFDFNYFGFTYKVIAFRDAGKFYTIWHEHGFFDVLKEDFKLPLRRLSSMTDDEKRQCDIESNLVVIGSNHIEGWAARINWLRARLIDVDGLIPSGLAIDAETITTK
jgi:hypothetical protein